MVDYLNHSTANSLSGTTTAPNSGKPVDQKAKETAVEFEAFFLSQMLNNMTSGLQTDKTFGGGEAEKIFKDMLNDEYAKSMSRQGGIGIADMVYREILALQEV